MVLNYKIYPEKSRNEDEIIIFIKVWSRDYSRLFVLFQNLDDYEYSLQLYSPLFKSEIRSGFITVNGAFPSWADSFFSELSGAKCFKTTFDVEGYNTLVYSVIRKEIDKLKEQFSWEKEKRQPKIKKVDKFKLLSPVVGEA